MRHTLPLAALLFVFGCASEPDPQVLVDAAIAAHGGEAMDRAEATFTFRGIPFSVVRDGGRFEYSRFYRDSLNQNIRDVIDNEGAHRFVGEVEVDIDELEVRRIGTAVNSVAYFFLLPIPLNDDAVNKRYVGSQTIRGVAYELVEVTFEQDGGGRDFQDVFVYWIHSERSTIDYMAYSYELGANETGPNATGIRFREAGNVRDIGGYRVQDYRNYTSDPGVDLTLLGLMYEAGTLRVVSDIQLENVRVESL